MLLSRPLSGNLLRPMVPFVPHLKPLTITLCASKRDSHGHNHYDGKLVDQNMILLRMRIREIEAEERKSCSEAPSDWTEGEKKYFASYGSDVCEAVGLLQTLLMNTRPCLALGMVALVMLCMSVSLSLAGFHLVELTKRIISI